MKLCNRVIYSQRDVSIYCGFKMQNVLVKERSMCGPFPDTSRQGHGLLQQDWMLVVESGRPHSYLLQQTMDLVAAHRLSCWERRYTLKIDDRRLSQPIRFCAVVSTTQSTKGCSYRSTNRMKARTLAVLAPLLNTDPGVSASTKGLCCLLIETIRVEPASTGKRSSRLSKSRVITQLFFSIDR